MGIQLIRRIAFLCILCLLALPIAAEEELWEWVTPWPQGHDLYSATAGNGITVAVGRNGSVLTSTDGVGWRTRQTGSEYALRDVAWANGLFVAVGGNSGEEFSPGPGVILTSDDGINWIERHREDHLTLNAVVWTGAQFVAVGIGDRVLLSRNGLNWSETDLGGSQFIWDLAWNGSLLVALGRSGYFGGPPTFFKSDGGEVWQQVPIGREYAPDSIAASGGRFVAIGSQHDALVSDDGQTWIEAPYVSSRELTEIVGDGDRFVATGGGVAATSLDGYVWSVEERPTQYRVYGLARTGYGYLAVGEDGFMMSSLDGSIWTQLSTASFDLPSSWEINELVMGGSTIVGVGQGSAIITGKHGTEWVRQSSPATNGDLSSVIWTGSAFWTVGSDRIMWSPDGVLWADAHFDPEVRLWDIVWNGSLFVAVGWNAMHTEAQKLILTSPDGRQWSSHWFDVEDAFFTVGWTGTLFVAVGRGANYLTSVDGATWEQQGFPEGVTLLDSAWNGDRLVGVGGRSESGGVIFTTDDGIGWTESVLPEPAPSWFEDVTWTGTHFVAVSRSSGDVIFTSTDGISWLSETTGTGVWPVSVVGDERSLFVSGRGFQIIRRTTPLADPEPPRRSGRRVVPVADKLRPVPLVR